MFLLQRHQIWNLGLAGNAPCGPEIQKNGLATEVGELNQGTVEAGQCEITGGNPLNRLRHTAGGWRFETGVVLAVLAPPLSALLDGSQDVLGLR